MSTRFMWAVSTVAAFGVLMPSTAQSQPNGGITISTVGNNNETASRLNRLEASLASLQQAGGGYCEAGTVSCDPCTTCCPSAGWYGAGWYGAVDYLLWRVNRSGLDVALYETGDDDIIGPGNLVRVNPDYTSAFRFAVGRATTSGWDVGLRWTRLESSEDIRFQDPDEYSWATRVHPEYDDIEQDLGYAESGYDVELDLVDLELGYWLYAGKFASFRPFSGIRFSRIDQEMHTLYADDVDPLVAGEIATVDETLDMDAVGLTFGSDARIPLFGQRVNFFGRFSGGVHVAEFDSRFEEFDVDESGYNVRVTDGERRTIGSLETAVGMLVHVLEGQCFRLDVLTGYEMHTYLNMADFVGWEDDILESAVDRGAADLGLDGLFVRLIVSQ